MLQSYVLVLQEEGLIQLLKNLWHHVNYVGISYYLPSDKGYERILWKHRGYECVERLRTTALRALQHSKYLNGKVFRSIYSREVRGAWNTGQLLIWEVVEKSLRTTALERIKRNFEDYLLVAPIGYQESASLHCTVVREAEWKVLRIDGSASSLSLSLSRVT